MPAEFRVALLGQGFMGKAHSNAYCQAPHFFDLPCTIKRTLLCGRDPATLSAMASRWGGEETSTDWRAAIERPEIDAVYICLPNHLHAAAAIAAALAGKIVLCEKPMALSLDDARAMTEAARGVPTLVWFNYRRAPAIAFARRLFEEGRLGRVFHYNASYKQQWGADPTRPPSWKMDRSLAGSGVGDDLLTHLLDSALYLNGSIDRVVATTRTFAHGRAVDDAVVAMVEFANGSVGTFEATRFGIGCKNRNAFEVPAERGRLRFDLERLNHLEFVDATEPPTDQGLRDILVTDMQHPIVGNFWRPGHIIGYEHTFIAAIAEFLHCLSRHEDFHPNFSDGLAVQHALDAVQRSARTGQWTTV